MDLRLQLFQYDIIWENPAANRAKLDKYLASSPEKQDLAVFPEMFNSGFTMNAGKMAETMDGPTIRWMKERAAQYDTALAGSLIIREEENYFNRFVLVEANGAIHHYDKRHLFSLSKEPEIFTPGNQRVTIVYKGWKIFPQVCYDLRFPVWARNDSEYDLYLNVANWPVMRSEAWNTLLKARSIENQAFVVGVNRFGKDGHGIYHAGDSSVYDPMGNDLLKISDEENVKTVTLNRELITNTRSKFPFLKDRDSFKIIL